MITSGQETPEIGAIAMQYLRGAYFIPAGVP